MSNKSNNGAVKKTPKRTFYFIGQVLETDKLTPAAMETLLQQTADKFVGAGKVTIGVDAINAKIMKFTVYRRYNQDFTDNRWLQDGTFRLSSDMDNLFSEDQKLIMGERYTNPMQWIGVYASANLYFQKSEVIKDYKKAARENHASVIKHVALNDLPDRLEMEVEVN